MNKILLTSAVALATFGASQAVSAAETNDVAARSEANVQTLPNERTTANTENKATENKATAEADKKEEKKDDATAKAEAEKAKEKERKEAARKAVESTERDLTIDDIYNYTSSDTTSTATTTVTEVKPVKIMDQFGNELKIDGKTVEITPEKEGTKTVDVKGKHATYRLTVQFKDGKATLTKYPQVINEARPAEVKKGWHLKDNGKWEYVRGQAGDGEVSVLKSGWANLEGTWYLFDANGEMATGWHFVGGKWYFMNTSGAMATGWVKDNGTWYYLNASGDMATGWIKDGNTWYYLNSNGSMKANTWFELGDKWYYVNASGALAVNTTVGGYTVNGNGEWVR